MSNIAEIVLYRHITGTLIWYYYVCKREVWLGSRRLNPNQEDYFLEMGRLIHENAYLRDRKEITIPYMKFDLIKRQENEFIIGEIKKSSRFLLPAKMQLAFYLYQLKRRGLNLKGELLIPKEKKRIPVELTQELEDELKESLDKIKVIINSEKPPEPEKIYWCKNCAYNEFCWAEV